MTTDLAPMRRPQPQIIGLDSEHLHGAAVPWHRHLHAQLLYPAVGAIRVWAGGSIWMVHSRSALWLPPRMPHKLVANSYALLKTVLVSESHGQASGDSCFITGISPLLRELLIAINQLPQRDRDENPRFSPRFAALETLILDEIKAGGKMSLELPWPKSARLSALCEEIFNHQASRPSLESMADRLSVSSRTLMRLFVKETGLTFSHWVQQMHVVTAMSYLEEGASIAQIAARLGYASAESFGNMFKRKTGQSPGKFIS